MTTQTEEMSDSVVVHCHDDGGVEVTVAPERARFALSLLAEGSAVVGFIGGLMVIADQVAYRPVAFADQHGTLLCERVPWKEDRVG